MPRLIRGVVSWRHAHHRHSRTFQESVVLDYNESKGTWRKGKGVRMREQDKVKEGGGFWRKLTEQERKQLRFLIVGLLSVVTAVVLASLVAGIIVTFA